MTIPLIPIAHVISPRTELTDDLWADVESRIELAPEFTSDALLGLEQFSHVEVIYFFHCAAADRIERAARHPRGNSAWPKVGIFAQRGKDRPNRLGVSIARLISCQERQLIVRGLDAIDGTPVLDIKPVMQEFLPQGEIIQPAWSQELMRRYWHLP